MTTVLRVLVIDGPAVGGATLTGTWTPADHPDYVNSSLIGIAIGAGGGGAGGVLGGLNGAGGGGGCAVVDGSHDSLFGDTTNPDDDSHGQVEYRLQPPGAGGTNSSTFGVDGGSASLFLNPPAESWHFQASGGFGGTVLAVGTGGVADSQDPPSSAFTGGTGVRVGAGTSGGGGGGSAGGGANGSNASGATGGAGGTNSGEDTVTPNADAGGTGGAGGANGNSGANGTAPGAGGGAAGTNTGGNGGAGGKARVVFIWLDTVTGLAKTATTTGRPAGISPIMYNPALFQ